MQELIFNIEEVFDNQQQNGCLSQYNSGFYHIPAYQRGYKWASVENGAVSILLNDLWAAFQKAENSRQKEYYLQYITVKPVNIKGQNCLEVIDGQQRLTTLSILISALSAILEIENISNKKLDYAIRDNFFSKFIYNSTQLIELVSKTWEQLLIELPELNKQDVYYLFEAAKKCFNKFNSDLEKQSIKEFYAYLLKHVMLIVNSVEPHVASETVFRNLNSNKVPLTEAELIKGLIITKVGRHTDDNKKHFLEITEKRINIGRRWDELTAWANTPEISTYFFNKEKDGMFALLSLVAAALENDALKIIKSSSQKDFPLFNFYLEQANFIRVYDKLLEIYNTLESWFHENTIYNLLGYNRFAKGSDHNKKSYLIELLNLDNKVQLLERLEVDKNNFYKDFDIGTINYLESEVIIHRILLALNVFVDGKKDVRFDFYNYETQSWTLEHIFPQTPEGKNNILKETDKKAIKDILGKTISKEVKAVLNLAERSPEEKEIYYKALKEHPALNSLGNMCLLTRSDNSSNGNKFFDEKRENILRLIQNGSFVPKHTFDVFSKMFEGSNISNMTFWTKEDIEMHLLHIAKSLNLTTHPN